jgi:hypothetical protein
MKGESKERRPNCKPKIPSFLFFLSPTQKSKKKIMLQRFVGRRFFSTEHSFAATAAAAAARLNMTFRDPEVLAQALTHPSYRSKDPTVARTNEKLSLLGMCV